MSLVLSYMYYENFCSYPKSLQNFFLLLCYKYSIHNPCVLFNVSENVTSIEEATSFVKIFCSFWVN